MTVELLLFALVVLIVCGMVAAAAQYMPVPNPMRWIIPAAVLIVGAVVILVRMSVIV
jgi:hypothetical protein